LLVLSRRLNEKLYFPTLDATVKVLDVKQGVVRLGVEAPPDVPVLRDELRNLPGPGPESADGEGPLSGRGLDRALHVARSALEVACLQLEAGRTGEAQTLLAAIQADLKRLRLRCRRQGRGPSVLPS